MKVWIVFREQHKYDSLGSVVNSDKIIAVCASESIAEKIIEEEQKVPQEKQKYFYTEYRVVEETGWIWA